jgi:hypothetical protein
VPKVLEGEISADAVMILVSARLEKEEARAHFF